MISILIPTINNTDFLKKCIEYIEKNTILPYEVIIFNNGGNSESTKFIEDLPYKNIRSPINQGVSKAYNALARISTGQYLLFWDDDKLLLKNWDINIINLIEEDGIYGWKSLVEIWPFDTNPCSLQFDLGRSPAQLDEKKLSQLTSSVNFPRMVSLSVSQLMTRELFEALNGYDENFYPGFGSDPDIMWRAFCFLEKNPGKFLNANKSFYYHFTSSTTERIFHFKLITKTLRAYGHILFRIKHGFWPRSVRKRTYHGTYLTDM